MRQAFVALGLALGLTSCAGEPPLRDRCNADSIPDAFARAGAALVWPGQPRAFHVDDHGALTNGLWRLGIHLADGAGAGPQRVAYEDRWLPIAHWTRLDGAIRWDFEAVAFPARAPDDSVLAVSLIAEASNTGSGPRPARLRATLDTLADPVFVAADGATPSAGDLHWATPGEQAPVCAWAEAGGPAGAPDIRWTLAPGARRRTRLLLVSHPVGAGALRGLGRRSHAHRGHAVRRFWTSQVERGTAFDLNDAEVTGAVRAARVVLLACRERTADGWIPIGGPFHYRDTWIRDGARLVYALSVHGYTSEAREAASGVARLQWPNGAFLTQRGQLDGPGQALWMFGEAFLRPPGSPEVAEIAARATRCWRWSEGQRELGRQSGWPLGRLLPFGTPRDNELVRAQLVGNDAWMLAGYAAAARLCGAAGRRDDSLAIEATRGAYLADFRLALGRSASPDIPPSWQGPGRDWGNVTVLWPTRLIDPGDARAARLARRLWSASRGTMLSYGSLDTIQSYVGADLAVWALLAQRPAMAESVLADLLHWRNASGAHAEVFSRTTRDFGRNLPPHPTAAAALLALVRNAVICDDPDTLLLTPGARPAWWREGRVRRAPTRWGMVDLDFQRTEGEARWDWTPVPVWTLLRLPAGTTLAGAPPEPLRPGADSTSVLAPPGVGHARVSLSSSPRAS